MTAGASFVISAWMRVLFALMAAIALLASPVAALARPDCVASAQPISVLADMSAAGEMAMADDSAMPCCPPADQKPSKGRSQRDNGCAQACAAINTMALPSVVTAPSESLSTAPVRFAVLASTSARSLEPRGLERPPRSLA